MKKNFVIIISFLFLLSACGTIMNDRKPPSSMSTEALNIAKDKGLVKNANRYIVGDIAYIFIFPIGFPLMVAGLAIDFTNNATYQIVDMKLFNAWYTNYKKTLK